MPETIVKKIWGRELWIANTDKYCGKILEINKGFRSSMHYHKDKDETFYILKGKVLMEVEGKAIVMESGDIQRLLPGQKHRFTGLEKSKMIEFSTHHEESDSYRETKSEKVDLDKLQSDLLKLKAE
ncbi:MAG: cupin domain-containing protein [Candidatus Nanoarchaeia archaeon]|nr:cupin domain-containing protein [Candidatus Nanoarchaeia archaeon]MDD5740808.1 cupin domain-containing protein [Candidatus Nanoarchaeia archaeon]